MIPETFLIFLHVLRSPATMLLLITSSVFLYSLHHWPSEFSSLVDFFFRSTSGSSSSTISNSSYLYSSHRCPLPIPVRTPIPTTIKRPVSTERRRPVTRCTLVTAAAKMLVSSTRRCWLEDESLPGYNP